MPFAPMSHRGSLLSALSLTVLLVGCGESSTTDALPHQDAGPEASVDAFLDVVSDVKSDANELGSTDAPETGNVDVTDDISRDSQQQDAAFDVLGDVPSDSPSTDAAVDSPPDVTLPEGDPVIALRLTNGHSLLMRPETQVTPFDVTNALNAVSPGQDKSFATSPNGQWFAMATTRFACPSWLCLSVVDSKLAAHERITPGGQELQPDGPLAITSKGDMVVYSDRGGPHTRDLFATFHNAGKWTSPILLTAGSTYSHNTLPAVSFDGVRIVFDCGPVPYGGAGTSVCEVSNDGSGFRKIIGPSSEGWGTRTEFAHHGDFSPRGGYVFEASRTGEGERIWYLPDGATTPTLLGSFNNDNSPCVLADGRVASLYLGRTGNPGFHELKIMNHDGTNSKMVLIDTDILDDQISCGN